MPTERPLVRWWVAILGYAALVAGMVIVAAPAQLLLGVGGIWITEAVVIALPALAILLLARVRFAPYLGLGAPSWKHVLVALVVASANQPIVSLVTWAVQHVVPAKLALDFEARQRGIELFFRGRESAMLFAVTIAAPLGEEVFFRGFAFPALRRAAGPLWAALITGALFSAIHGDPVGFVGLMEIGVLCAALRHWSGSLWVAVLAHAVNNGFAGGAMVLGLEDPSIPPPTWMLVSGAILLVVFVVAGLRVLRAPSPVEPREERRTSPSGPAWAAVAVWAVSVVLGASAWLYTLHP